MGVARVMEVASEATGFQSGGVLMDQLRAWYLLRRALMPSCAAESRGMAAAVETGCVDVADCWLGVVIGVDTVVA